MADQVNPTSSLAPGPAVALLATAALRPSPEKMSASTHRSNNPSTPSNFNPQPLENQPATRPALPEVAANNINAHLEKAASDLKIQVDKATGRTVFSVVNQKTGEVLLQVPSEEVLAMARNLRTLDSNQSASGLLLDKKG